MSDRAYPVIVAGLEMIWATGKYPGKFADINPDAIARCYARLTANCRTWLGDAAWTIDRDVERVRGTKDMRERTEYIAKIAHWWRLKGRTILRVSEDQLADPLVYLPIVIAKLVDSYYIDSIAASFKVYDRVNVLMAQMDKDDPVGFSDGIDDDDAEEIWKIARESPAGATTAIVSEEAAARLAAMDPNDPRYGRLHIVS